jgi:hypothetical protein
MKSLSSALQKKFFPFTRPISVLDSVRAIGLSKPFNLSELIRKYEIEPPLPPEILFPERDQGIDPHNIVIRWKDPGKGTHRQADLFRFIMTGSIPGTSETIFQREVDGRINQMPLPTLQHDSKYSFTIVGRVDPWWGSPTQSTFTTIKQPQQTVGFSKITILIAILRNVMLVFGFLTEMFRVGTIKAQSHSSMMKEGFVPA